MNTHQKPLLIDSLVLENKWRTVLFLALAELLSMGLWFSASAVTPSLASLWGL